MSKDMALAIVSEGVIPLVVLVLAPILARLAMRALEKFQEWSDIRITEKQERRIRDLVEDAIHYAEEQSRKAIRGEGTALSGPEKLETAIDHFSRRARKEGLDDIVRESSDEIGERIEAALSRKRIEYAGGGGLDRSAPVSTLDVRPAIISTLEGADLTTVGDVLDYGPRQLDDIDGVGEKTVNIILDALAKKGG